MMRALLLIAAALVLVSAAAAGSGTVLKITLWQKGRPGASKMWTLRCGPPGGTLPHPAAACRALARHPRALRPVRTGIFCTQQWDGPQVALVRGTYRGQRVRSSFNRTNGCEIGRWNALRALFPISD